MMTFRHRASALLATVAAGALLAFASPAARAADAVSIVSDSPGDRQAASIVSNAQTNTTALETSIATSQAAIIEALRELSGQNTVNARAATQAASQMMDTWDARETGRRITDVRVRGAIAAVPGASVCNVITGSVAARNAFGATQQWREEIITQQMGYFAGAGVKDRDQAIAQRIDAHCAIGATAYDQFTGLCGSATQQPVTTEDGATVTPTIGRDLNANVLLDPPNQTLSQADKQAANSFLLNALNAAPLAPMPKGSADGSAGHEANRRLAAENNAAIARQSVAQAVGAAILADDAPMPGTTSAAGDVASSSGAGGADGVKASISTWAEGTAKQVIGYNASGGNFPNGVSRAAYMKLRAMAWFWNPNWATNVGSQSTDQVIKDIALINAWAVYQNWETDQQLKRMNLTLATMLATMETRNH